MKVVVAVVVVAVLAVVGLAAAVVWALGQTKRFSPYTPRYHDGGDE